MCIDKFAGDDGYCHCGKHNMHWHNTGLDYSNGLRYYCRACANNRCDTSEGMESGCPNA